MEKALTFLPLTARQLLSRLIGMDASDVRERRGALLAFAIRIASAGIAFLSQVLLARWIGSFEFGIYTYVWVWLNVIGVLCTLGFATSVVRFLPQYLASQSPQLVRGFLRAGRVISVAAAMTVMAAGLAILLAYPGIVASYYFVPFMLGLVCLPAYALTDFQDGVGRARSWIDLGLAPPYILRPILLLGCVGLAVALGNPKNAVTVVSAIVAATWITAAVQYFLQKRRMARDIPAGPRQYRIGLWLSVSLPALLLEGFALMMTNLDIIILDRFVSPDQIAIYFAAARTISLIGFIHFAVTAAWSPKFARLHAMGDGAGVAEVLATARKWTLLPTLAGGAAILVLGKPLLWMFGPEFTAGYSAMFVLVLGLMARAAVGPAQGLLVVTGRHNLAAAIIGMTVVANVILNLVLIPRFGLLGAAAATAAAFALESLLLHVAATGVTRARATKSPDPAP